MTGIKSNGSRGRSSYLVLDGVADPRKMASVGWMRKMAGKTVMATTMDRLRRSSRSSLRTTARMRLGSTPIIVGAPRRLRRSTRGRRPRVNAAPRR